MVGCVWTDGIVQTAESWEALEETIRQTQFEKIDPESFRAEMGIRAWNWSKVEISTEGSSEDFFWELERACLLQKLSGKVLTTEPRKPRKLNMASIQSGGNDPIPYYGE